MGNPAAERLPTSDHLVLCGKGARQQIMIEHGTFRHDYRMSCKFAIR
jgi:hypothetical protein